MSTGPDPEFEQLLEYVRDTRGFDYAGYRRPTLMRRFEKRMQSVHVDGWGAYRSFLEGHPDEFNELFNTILINVTGFFRDRETWDVVAADVIPKLLEARDEEMPLRVWSAGCASGEEPYTLAMLLAEALGEEEFRRRVKIYATDIDEEALAEAREANYPAKALQAVPPGLRARYFVEANHGWAFRNDLRRSVIFGRNDLHRDPPISRVDLLLSRNTLMYFGTDVQARILANYYFALNRGGFLVVGKAEALQSGRRFFVPYDLKRRIFVKDGSLEPAFRVPRLPAPMEPISEEREAPDLGEMAFEHAPIAQIVVDEQNRVASLNQAARSMFGLKLKDIGRRLQDLEVSYRPLELRSLIDEVRAHRHAVARKDVRWTPPGGADEPRSLDVQVAPLSGPGESMAGVTVSFVDATLHRALEEDLERSRRELETAYEELQSTVEELETTNEELQSTNEELETTNEELQSTNEELETMNEELQSTNEELETMNDELRDRTDETLRANSFLASVLSSIQQAVVVVDRGLQIVAWNRRAKELWGLRDDEVEGEHLLNLDIGIAVSRLRDPIRAVLAGERADTLVLEGHDRRGKPTVFTISFAPLQARPESDEADGAILLVAADHA
ncbi:MAG: PAS domain-containing protein [Actinobacteria bacterium]|nr:PAS domain-containing protein [Actinomycetota bacterium]MBV8561767.1 PAS domain-containing protein [Actinomycetota bacterium]